LQAAEVAELEHQALQVVEVEEQVDLDQQSLQQVVVVL
jgi:hypothetical protein